LLSGIPQVIALSHTLLARKSSPSRDIARQIDRTLTKALSGAHM
jgi:hypothetical protein